MGANGDGVGANWGAVGASGAVDANGDAVGANAEMFVTLWGRGTGRGGPPRPGLPKDGWVPPRGSGFGPKKKKSGRRPRKQKTLIKPVAS